ncbi:hypothetical protein QTJ16_005118 [Diplocarpon rosae]|uniref:Uncharacterized protein n=1 Tax=Diplocarpon rosae TaxID=946125 RepID=A0AAD9SXX9_9HELO|nr:hypothetical protein QTJ16_005118 [Diplocarpon rosae]PBP21928.1 hypothetical protein BUE80_DR007232 [Diplocarpon rosae]
MGAILSCFAILTNKKSRSAKKASATEAQETTIEPSSQLRSSQQPVREGLADEHLASVPPPSSQAQAREGVQGEAKALRNVAVEAPVPVPATDNPTTKDKRAVGEMATDEEYMSFLDKANQDPNEGVARGQSGEKAELKAVEEGVQVPECIATVLAKGDSYYVSDADEPFVGVALKLEGKGLPDEVTFAKLVQYPTPYEAKVQIMDIGEWDTQGQYKDVVNATREACQGKDVRVYRIAKGGSRVEYWVLGVADVRLVGAKALAVES